MSKRDVEKFDRRRGRHKKRASRETDAWAQFASSVEPVSPPPWMDAATSAALAALRHELDPWKLNAHG